MRGVIDDTCFVNIASTIREKTGTEKTYSAEEMPGGVNEVYEAGKQVGIREVWDMVLERESFSYLFYMWGNEYIIPDRVIRPIGIKAMRMFMYCERLKGINKELFDLSQAFYSDSASDSTNTWHCGYCESLEVYPDIGLQAGNYTGTFNGCSSLHTIEVLRFEENTAINSNCFAGCKSLKNLSVEGVIGRGISFSVSPLSVESMKNVITHLKNYAGTTKEFTYTLTLKSDCWTALDTEGTTAPGDVTWRDYITVIGWKAA